MVRALLACLCCILLNACTCVGSDRMTSLTTVFPETQRGELRASPFTKWTNVLARMEKPAAWPEEIGNMPVAAMAEKVNDEINSYKYMKDRREKDYWETPDEFFARGGGDCEDFAIAKYAWLRDLGVPEEDLRLAVVYDRHVKDIHTIVVLDTKKESLLLDNQISSPRDAAALVRYQPLYSLGRDNYWLHI